MVCLPSGKRSANQFQKPRHSSKVKMKMILLCAALVRSRDAPTQLSLSWASSLTIVCDQWLYFSIIDPVTPPLQISSRLMDIYRSSLLHMHTFFACTSLLSVDNLPSIPNERLCFCLSVVKPLDYMGYAIDAEFLLSQYTLLKHDETILSVTIMHAAAPSRSFNDIRNRFAAKHLVMTDDIN